MSFRKLSVVLRYIFFLLRYQLAHVFYGVFSKMGGLARAHFIGANQA